MNRIVWFKNETRDHRAEIIIKLLQTSRNHHFSEIWPVLFFYYWSVFKTENCFHNKINVLSRIRISSRTLNFEIFKPIIYRLKKFSKKVQRENRRLRKKYSKWQKPCMSEQMSDVEKLLLCDVKNKSSIAFWPANYLICLWRNGYTGLFSPSSEYLIIAELQVLNNEK